MRTEILFKDIRRSEYIENFIGDKVELLTDKLIQPDSDLHVIVRVEKERQRTDNRHPVFHCEVTIKSGVSVKPLVISKQDRNIFRAIVSSFDTLKVLLGKNHDRLRHDRRRRGGIAELNESYEPDLDSELLGPELVPPSIAST
jgi:ribosome-associated translation inhibitor RaiA